MATVSTPSRDGRAALTLGILAALLLGDLAFVALHVAERASDAAQPVRRLDVEGSYAERFQHAKEFAAAAGLAALAGRTRVGLYGAWALLFGYLLVDDHAELHERGGEFLAAMLSLPAPFGLRASDLGELAVSAIAGALLLGTILLARRTAGSTARAASARLLALLLVLALFGVVVDMLHVAFDHLPVKGLTVLEDGGEMVAMSLAVAYVVRLGTVSTRPRQNSATLPQEACARRSGR